MYKELRMDEKYFVLVDRVKLNDFIPPNIVDFDFNYSIMGLYGEHIGFTSCGGQLNGKNFCFFPQRLSNDNYYGRLIIPHNCIVLLLPIKEK